jgi:hypothetical protein
MKIYETASSKIALGHSHLAVQPAYVADADAALDCRLKRRSILRCSTSSRRTH